MYAHVKQIKISSDMHIIYELAFSHGMITTYIADFELGVSSVVIMFVSKYQVIQIGKTKTECEVLQEDLSKLGE